MGDSNHIRCGQNTIEAIFGSINTDYLNNEGRLVVKVKVFKRAFKETDKDC